jgi:hypothetical protein
MLGLKVSKKGNKVLKPNKDLKEPNPFIHLYKIELSIIIREIILMSLMKIQL